MAKQFTKSEIVNMIISNNLYMFYNSRGWRNLSKRIIKEQNNECQPCKENKKVTPAFMVHHEKPLKKRPDLAYSRYYTDENGNKKKQLIAICFDCHEEKHNKAEFKKKKFINEEKW